MVEGGSMMLHDPLPITWASFGERILVPFVGLERVL
jgi:hypothetical protein